MSRQKENRETFQDFPVRERKENREARQASFVKEQAENRETRQASPEREQTENRRTCQVSVVIPVYNIRPAVLKQCVESVLTQSLREIEVFLVDDGSAKDCADFCDHLGARDARITVLHQENQGVSVARNSAMNRARGKWIAFVDGDDWIGRDMLRELARVGEARDADIVLCDCCMEYRKRSVENHFFPQEHLDSNRCGKDLFALHFLCPRMVGFRKNMVQSAQPWAKLYRRDFLERNGLRFLERLRRVQDLVFNLYAYEYAGRIVYMRKAFYHYRKGGDSGFAKYRENILELYDCVYEEIERFNARFQKDARYTEGLYYHILLGAYVILNMYFFHADNRRGYAANRKRFLEMLDEPYYRAMLSGVHPQYLSRAERVLLALMKRKQYGLIGCALWMKKRLYGAIGRGRQA